MNQSYVNICIQALQFRKDYIQRLQSEVVPFMGVDPDKAIDELFEKYMNEIKQIDKTIAYFDKFIERVPLI